MDEAEASALPPDLVEMKAEITRLTAQIDLNDGEARHAPHKSRIDTVLVQVNSVRGVLSTR